MMKPIVSFRCTQCGRSLDPPDGGKCSVCGRLLCMIHLRPRKTERGWVAVCAACRSREDA